MLVDTHAHLFWDSYSKDLNEVLARCVKNKVYTIINVGVDVHSSNSAAQQESNKIKIYSSIAIHPEESVKYYSETPEETRKMIDQDISELEKIYFQNPEKVVAVGECGLDFSFFTRNGYLPDNISIEQAKDLQRQLFQSQINLAKKLNLPLLLHVRDDRSINFDNSECWDQSLEMTKDHFGILHCYSGLIPTTQKALTSNFLISFAGNLTYKKNEYLREAVKFLPLEKIVLETDCPFLAPQSIRGQRNEPSSVKEIAELISQLKGISFEAVAKQTTENFNKLISK